MKQPQQKINIALIQSLTPQTASYRKRKIIKSLDKQSNLFQNIFTQRSSKTNRDIPNYLLQNTKNLHNYTQRLDKEDMYVDNAIRPHHIMIHPRRILQIRQHYSLLKKTQKIKLQTKLELRKPTVCHSLNKINKTFHINDVNIDLQHKYSSQSKRDYHYQPLNHLRGTFSQIGKRAKIIKKEAYDKTFGPDISALATKTASYPYRKTIDINCNITKQIKLQSYQGKKEFMQIRHRNRIQKIVQSLSSGRKIKQLKGKKQIDNQSGEQKNIKNWQMQTTMLTAITNMNKICVESEYVGTKLQVIDDLNKVNKQYFEDLLRHKENRLNKRRQLMQQINP